MDLRHKIGQRLVAGLAGAALDDGFVSLVRDYKVANVILFRRNVQSKEQLRGLCAEIQELVREQTGHSAFIMIDQEGGVVSRLPPDMANVPGAMALAATGDINALREAARVTACQLRYVGVNFNLAPDLDVNSNPANPVIGVRSFGDDPQLVSKWGKEFCLETLREGILVCGKHFPGHGDTAVDSHIGLPCVEKSLNELMDCELLPFRAAADQIPAMMSSHILFPKIEPEGLPATMSRRIMTGLLKQTLGYRGLVVSDCMEMDAIAKYYGTVKGVAAAIGAGVDLVLISHTAQYTREAAELLYQSYQTGALSMEELDASVEKILREKRRFADCSPLPEWPAGLAERAQLLRKRGFALVQGRLPALGERPFFTGCANYRANMASSEEAVPAFAQVMQRRFGGSALVTSPDPGESEIAAACAAARGSTCIVVNTYNAHLKKGQAALLAALAGLKIPMAVVALRNPYDLLGLPRQVAAVAAWEYTPQSLEALIPFLEGKERFQGVVPLRVFLQD